MLFCADFSFIAVLFLNDISKHRLKVCHTFTGRHFCAGQTSTQRSESMNFVMKGGDQNKICLGRMTLFQAILHLDKTVQNREQEWLIKMKVYVREGMEFISLSLFLLK